MRSVITRLLRMLTREKVTIASKRRRSVGRRGIKRGDGATFERGSWAFPREYIQWAKEREESPERLLIHFFCDTVKQCEYANYSMLRVSVQKNDLTAVFGVNVKRIGYFFQDRDIQLTENGVKKRIFHIVPSADGG